MRIVFCDDDQGILTKLQGYVEEYFKSHSLSLPETGAYTGGGELLEKEGRVDIAFLDVEMPGISGVQVGAALMERNPLAKVFIVTSYPDYLDEAMKYRVFRFLSKPVDRERLFRNLSEALYQLNMETVMIPVETADGVFTIPADEMICAEAKGRQTVIYTADRDYISSEGIIYWQEKLDLPCMFVPFRGFVVNMKYVEHFTKSEIHLHHNGKELRAYLAKRRYQDFKKKYFLYMESMR